MLHTFYFLPGRLCVGHGTGTLQKRDDPALSAEDDRTAPKNRAAPPRVENAFIRPDRDAPVHSECRRASR